MGKFRGKDTSEGKWHYGFLVGNKKGQFFIYEEDDENGARWWNIDSKTIGRFVGLQDRNKVENWEGDILKTYNGIGVITYNTPSFAVNSELQEVYTSCHDDFEVIGNIHDNPELVEQISLQHEMLRSTIK